MIFSFGGKPKRKACSTFSNRLAYRTKKMGFRRQGILVFWVVLQKNQRCVKISAKAAKWAAFSLFADFHKRPPYENFTKNFLSLKKQMILDFTKKAV